MTVANVFQLEMASTLADRRTLVMRLALPLLLSLPFVLIVASDGGEGAPALAMPAQAKVAGLVMLLLFLTFFGAAVGIVRRRSEGQMERLRLLPLRRWVVMLDLLLAGAAVDLIQAASVLGLYLLVNAHGGLSAASALLVAGLLCAAVMLLNLLGMLLAGVMRSNPEVHLLGALAVGLIAFVSGLLPVPQRVRPMVDVTAAWNPIAALARALTAAAQPDAPSGGAAATIAAGAAVALTAALILIRAWPRAGRRAHRPRPHDPTTP